MSKIALALHGGCGVLPRAELAPALERDFRAGLTASLKAGWDVLTRGGSALDAVEAAVVVMEDSPLFNAGHGSVFNAAGGHELDAALMEGATLRAGVIAAARRIRNPIRVARRLMDTDTVMLAGDGADAWAEAAGFAPVSPDYFATDWRRRTLAEMKALEATGEAGRQASEAQKHGTVGAVARDRAGNFAAATSTGGFTNKPVGRVGDSPIIGAGTYADNATCAISATGRGEFFIRKVLAHEIAARIAYRGETLAAAAEAMIQRELTAPGWNGGAGLVGVDRFGNVVMPFNTEGMYRAAIAEGGEAAVAIYGE